MILDNPDLDKSKAHAKAGLRLSNAQGQLGERKVCKVMHTRQNTDKSQRTASCQKKKKKWSKLQCNILQAFILN